jgi:hypothetical protein
MSRIVAFMNLKLGPYGPPQHLLEDRGNQKQPVSKWLIATTSGYTLHFSHQTGK